MMLLSLGSRLGRMLGFVGVCGLAGGVTWGSWGVLPPEASWMAGIFVLAALCWATELLPLFATSLLVIGLECVLLANPGGWGFLEGGSGEWTFSRVIHSAGDPILMLFFGGFLLARAAVKERVDVAMSALLLRPFLSHPRILLLAIMGVTTLFSMWMSNTATTAMMLVLVSPLLVQLPKGHLFRKGLVLAVPFAANLGGMGTPIASPPNAVAMSYLVQEGYRVGFKDWMLVAVPLLVFLLVLVWGGLCWRYGGMVPEGGFQLKVQGLTLRAWCVVATFVVTVGLWLTDAWHGLPASVVALFPAIVFCATGLLNSEDLKSLDWHVLILIAGGLALGSGLQGSGLGEALVGWLTPWVGDSLGKGMGLLLGVTLVLSTFMSNTAASNLVIPVGVSMLQILPGGEANLIPGTMGIALVASMAMSLPVSTPPNAMAYAKGELESRDLLGFGIWVGLLGWGLVGWGMPWWMQFLGIGGP